MPSHWFVGLDFSLKFCFTPTGREPNCTVSSKAWWEVSRRGRSLERKCRRKKGKPEEDDLYCLLDCFCKVCIKVRAHLDMCVCVSKILWTFTSLHHSVGWKWEFLADYAPLALLLLKWKKKENRICTHFDMLQIDCIHTETQQFCFHFHIWPLDVAAVLCTVNCDKALTNAIRFLQVY